MTTLGAMTLVTGVLATTNGLAAPIAAPTPSVSVVVQPPPGVKVSASFKEQQCGKDMSAIVTITADDLSGAIRVVKVGDSNPVVTPYHVTSGPGGFESAKGPKLDCGAGVGPVRVSITYGPFAKLMFDQVFSPKTIHMSKGFGAPQGPPQEKVRLQVVSLTGSCDATTATMGAELEMWSASSAASAEGKMSFKLGAQPAQIVSKQISGANQVVSAPTPLSCATGIPSLHYQLLTGLGGEGVVEPQTLEYR
jgi:hypothetical protein